VEGTARQKRADDDADSDPHGAQQDEIGLGEGSDPTCRGQMHIRCDARGRAAGVVNPAIGFINQAFAPASPPAFPPKLRASERAWAGSARAATRRVRLAPRLRTVGFGTTTVGFTTVAVAGSFRFWSSAAMIVLLYALGAPLHLGSGKRLGMRTDASAIGPRMDGKMPDASHRSARNRQKRTYP